MNDTENWVVHKECERCGEPYRPTSNSQIYCSKECYNDHRKEYHKKYDKEYVKKPEIIEHLKEYRKKYYQKNKEKILKRQKEYRKRPEVKEHQREYNKKYNKKPEVIKHIKKYKKEHYQKNKEHIIKRVKLNQIKNALKQINNSIYIYDDNGNKIGFKREWFYDKYPKFTWDFYKEQGWIEKSLEMLNEANRICKGCGAHAMEVHHWRNFYKYPEIALKSSNLIVLCVFCHKEIHNKNKRYSLKIKELNKIR